MFALVLVVAVACGQDQEQRMGPWRLATDKDGVTTLTYIPEASEHQPAQKVLSEDAAQWKLMENTKTGSKNVGKIYCASEDGKHKAAGPRGDQQEQGSCKYHG